MAQIVTLTGIKAHTLRKWETRYSFLEPERTETNIRYYSDEQLKKLLNIAILTRNGYRISKIDKMSSVEINEIISSTLINNKEEDDISTLILSMLDMEEEKFDNVLKSHILAKGLLTTTTDLIYPFLYQVGVLWGMNKVIPAQEHFITCLIKRRMYATIDLLPYPQKGASAIIMFLLEDEHHEIGLLLAYYIARELGWRVYYLGQNVPSENIKAVVEITKPKALMSMFVTPDRHPIKIKIDELLSDTDLPFFVSGNPTYFENNIKNNQVLYLSNPNELIVRLNELF
jgi:DNA-binding transcriptional MerR regulator